MALDRLTKVDGGGISTTSDYRVGIITATKFVGPIEGTITATDGSFSGNVTIGGTLTYEDVTNIDSVGIITARDGIHVGAGVSAVGVGTFGSLDIGGDIDVDGHTNLDNVSIAGIATVTNSSNSNILIETSDTTSSRLVVKNSQRAFAVETVTGGIFRIRDGSVNQERLTINSSGNVSIPQDLDVDGHTNLDNVSIAGVTTAAGAIDLNGDIDVDGHTNLDNVSISGVTTITSIAPELHFTDTNHNSDYSIVINSGQFRIRDESNSENRFYIASDGSNFLNGDVHLGEVQFGTGSRTRVYSGQGSVCKNALMVTNPSASVPGRGAGVALCAIGSTNDYIGTLYAQRDGNGDNRGTTTLEGKDAIVIKTNAATSTITALTFATNGEIAIPTGSNTTSRLTFGGGVNIYHDNNFKIENGTGYLKLQSNNALYIDGSELFFRNAGGTNRWKIDSSGHLLPGTAGALDIGSTNAEIRHLYLGDSGHVKLGSDQDTQVFHDGSNFYIKNDTGNIVLKNAGADYLRAISTDSSVALLQNSGIKLQTTATGITVTGEVASSQNYPNVRPLLDFNFAATKKLDTRLDYIRKGVASFVNEFGKVVLVGDNVPRFDHDPDTRESKGLLIEESRTNLYTYSSNLSSDVGWGNTRITVTVNTTTTPDKTNNASTLTVNSGGNYAYAYVNFTTNNGTSYALSGWFKYINCQYVWLLGGEATDLFAYFDIQNGTIGTTNGYDCTITAYPDGWYRCTATRTKTGSTGSEQIGFGLTRSNNNPTNNQVGDAVYAWGAQQEVGAFPTSYIPTNGSSATREKDELTMSGSDLRDVFNDLEGTMFYEASVTDLTNDNQPIVAFRDNQNATGNEIPMGFAIGGSNPSIRTWIRSYVTGSQVNSFLTAHTSTGIAAGKPYKHMMAFKKDDFADSYNTGANSGQLTSSSGNMPTAGSIDELRFGQYYAYASQAKTYGLDSGHIKRFSYWPQRLTNTQLTTYIS